MLGASSYRSKSDSQSFNGGEDRGSSGNGDIFRGVYEISPGALKSYCRGRAQWREPSWNQDTPVLDGINSLTQTLVLLIFYQSLIIC